MILERPLISKGIFFVRMLLILLLVYAAVSKLLDFHDFDVQLKKSPMLAPNADWIVWIVPFSELLVSILLLVPRYVLLGLYSSFSLLVGFTTYIVLVLHFTENIPCSCGGILESLGWTEHIVFNLFFIVMAVLAIFLITHQKNYTHINNDILLRNKVRRTRKPVKKSRENL